MNKKILLPILAMCLMVLVLPLSHAAFAQTPSATPAANGNGNNSNNMCISSTTFSGVMTDPGTATGGGAFAIGSAIITAVFASINTIMNNIAYQFYTGLVGTSGFQNAVAGGIVLYLAIYGVMIMFNLAQVNGREAIGRLLKIGIVYSLVGNGASGWQFFNTYIGNLFVGGMNELIGNFASAGNGSSSLAFTSTATMTLNANAMQMLYVPMGEVFATKFIAAILALFTTCGWGWFVALILAFGLLEFVFMLIGALMTYVKSIIGLAFMFGIAPIFVAFLLFDRTRQIFIGWLNQVVSFALTPVMLFAFLSFYIQLISACLNTLLYSTPSGGQPLDFCWVNWFSAGYFDIHWWRPTVNGQAQGGECTQGTPFISLIDALYFAVLCYLGKCFSEFIEQIAKDISGGVGPGSNQMASPTSMIMKGIKEKMGGGEGGSGGTESTARTLPNTRPTG